MADGANLRLLLPRSIRRLPADLVAVVLLVVATGIAVLVPVVSETPLRIVLGLPFVLFVPGYAFVAALFPEQASSSAMSENEETQTADRVHPGRNGSIDGIERVALSFGLSIAITPLIGLGLNFTPFGIRLVPIVLSIGGFTLITTGIAATRRQALPAEERFQVPYREWYVQLRSDLFSPETQTDKILNVVLVVSLLLAVSSVGYAVLVPQSGETFTEFYLLTENETGARVASDYPTNFTEGQSKPLIVGIDNHEQQAVRYSVVVELQRVQVENNSTTVLEEEELRRFTPSVDDNATWMQKHNVTPTMTGERLRLTYLLYKGSPPNEPTTDNAYRELHLWVNVSGSEANRNYDIRKPFS